MANKFDSLLDITALAEEVMNESNDDFHDVPEGRYEVKLMKAELSESKTSGRPMVKMRWKVIAGVEKGQSIFTNQICDKGWQLKNIYKDISKLAYDETMTFKSYTDLENDLEAYVDSECLIEHKVKDGFSSVIIEKVY